MDEYALQAALTAFFGLIGLASNLFLIIIIAKCKEINAYYLTGALAATDLINGLFCAIGGGFDLYLVGTNQTEVQIPPKDCLHYPSGHYFPIPYHAGSMMMLLIAGDRLLSVSAVRVYFKLGHKYTIGLISFCLLYTIGAWSYFTYDMIVVMPQNQTVTKSCYGLYSGSVHFYDYYSTTGFVTAAVVVMMSTWSLLRWRARSHQQKQQQQQQVATSQGDGAIIKRNEKAARLLAMISLNTFCMWVVPAALVAILEPYEWAAPVIPYMWMLQPVHATTNLAIYFRKGSQLRQAFVELRKKQLQSSSASMYG